MPQLLVSILRLCPAIAGRQLGISEETVGMMVRRLRQRYRELFRQEIFLTVSDPSEVEDEARYLLQVLGD